MFKQALVGITCFLAGLLAAVGISSQAEGVRFEAAYGNCRHHLANDASWSYRDWGNYDSNMQLSPRCGMFGASLYPWKLGEWKQGLRVAYVNLGKIHADNTFPLDEKEYFRAKETKTPVNSATSRFKGDGGSEGFTLGWASEYPIKGFHFGAEAGAAALYSTWNAYFPNKEEEIYGCGKGWACADGWHGTVYGGASIRYGWAQITYRHYLNVHASQAGKNPLFIGPTTGPVDVLLIGVSISL